MTQESFDRFYLFIAKPSHKFKMPFLIVSEVLKGEASYFSEYFGGFRKLKTDLLCKRIDMPPKDLPEEFELINHGIEIPGYLANIAKDYGICDLQHELDEKLPKESIEKYFGVELEQAPDELSKKLSIARIIVNKEFSMIIEKKTESNSLKSFLEFLNKLPELSPVSF